MSIIYGPDAFTVGSDTVLQTYNAGWGRTLGTINWTILAADDYITPVQSTADSIYRYTGASSPTGNQETRADLLIRTDSTVNNNASCASRCDASGNGYVAAINPTAGPMPECGIYKVTSNGETFTQVAGSNPGVASATWYASKLTTTGTTTTHLDFTVGVFAALTYDDTTTPHTSGYPGLHIYQENAGIVPGIDNVSITDPSGLRIRRPLAHSQRS